MTSYYLFSRLPVTTCSWLEICHPKRRACSPVPLVRCSDGVEIPVVAVARRRRPEVAAGAVTSAPQLCSGLSIAGRRRGCGHDGEVSRRQPTEDPALPSAASEVTARRGARRASRQRPRRPPWGASLWPRRRTFRPVTSEGFGHAGRGRGRASPLGRLAATARPQAAEVAVSGG